MQTHRPSFTRLKRLSIWRPINVGCIPQKEWYVNFENNFIPILAGGRRVDFKWKTFYTWGTGAFADVTLDRWKSRSRHPLDLVLLSTSNNLVVMAGTLIRQRRMVVTSNYLWSTIQVLKLYDFFKFKSRKMSVFFSRILVYPYRVHSVT